MLQTMLAGGIVTGDRAQRQQYLHQPCGLCGHPTDNEERRHWQCPAVHEQAVRLLQHLPELPSVTRCMGIIPMNLITTPAQAQLLHMLVGVFVKHKAARREATTAVTEPTKPTTTPQLFVPSTTCTSLGRGSGARGEVEMNQEEHASTAQPSAARRMRKPGTPAGALPPHVAVVERIAPSGLQSIRMLHCRHCGAMADMVNRARFVSRRKECKVRILEAKCVKRQRLLGHETQQLSDRYGHDLTRVHKRRRREIAQALVELR